MASNSQEDIRDTKTEDKVSLGRWLDRKVKGRWREDSQREAIAQFPRFSRHWFERRALWSLRYEKKRGKVVGEKSKWEGEGSRCVTRDTSPQLWHGPRHTGGHSHWGLVAGHAHIPRHCCISALL